MKDFEVAMSHFEDTLAEVTEGVRADMEFGFTPYPTVHDCVKCPLTMQEKPAPCAHRMETPRKKIIVIDGIYHNDVEIGTL